MEINNPDEITLINDYRAKKGKERSLFNETDFVLAKRVFDKQIGIEYNLRNAFVKEFKKLHSKLYSYIEIPREKNEYQFLTTTGHILTGFNLSNLDCGPKQIQVKYDLTKINIDLDGIRNTYHIKTINYEATFDYNQAWNLVERLAYLLPAVNTYLMAKKIETKRIDMISKYLKDNYTFAKKVEVNYTWNPNLFNFILSDFILLNADFKLSGQVLFNSNNEDESTFHITFDWIKDPSEFIKDKNNIFCIRLKNTSIEKMNTIKDIEEQYKKDILEILTNSDSLTGR